MLFYQALILGLVQGLTEFLPVSSSAHLQMAKKLLNLPQDESLLYFDLLCHLGTLLALMIFLRKEIFTILISPKKIALFALAILPLIPAYFLLKPLRLWASNPAFLGYSLLITSMLLFAASRKKNRVDSETNPTRPKTDSSGCFGIKWPSVLCIGVMQTMALIPGISRSGSTIAAARFCGIDWMEAARFSFLLAVPTILGGEILETAKLFKGTAAPFEAVSLSCYLGGLGASFALGLLSVRFIFWIYEKEKVRPFAWYCLGAGLFAKVLFHG